MTGGLTPWINYSSHYNNLYTKNLYNIGSELLPNLPNHGSGFFHIYVVALFSLFALPGESIYLPITHEIDTEW